MPDLVSLSQQLTTARSLIARAKHTLPEQCNDSFVLAPIYRTDINSLLFERFRGVRAGRVLASCEQRHCQLLSGAILLSLCNARYR